MHGAWRLACAPATEGHIRPPSFRDQKYTELRLGGWVEVWGIRLNELVWWWGHWSEEIPKQWGEKAPCPGLRRVICSRRCIVRQCLRNWAPQPGRLPLRELVVSGLEAGVGDRSAHFSCASLLGLWMEVFTWLPCTCLRPYLFSLKGHQSHWIRAHPCDLILNLTSVKALSPNTVIARGTGVRLEGWTSTYEFWRYTIQPFTESKRPN